MCFVHISITYIFHLNDDPRRAKPWPRAWSLATTTDTYAKVREQEKFVTYNWSKKSVEVVDSGQPKISELNDAVKGHQQVLRLEVAMHYAMTV